ncbi:hypothetical protein ACFLXV_03125 [Chloroflexota bacterium]
MLKRIRWRWPKALLRGSSGVALSEVVVAIIILALILAAVPPVLVLILHSQSSWTEQRVAESLTRNQIEYIKAAEYVAANETQPSYTAVPTPDETYDVIIIAQPIDPVTKEDLPDGEDEDVQKITIKILHGDKLVLQTVNYKVDRLDIRAI